MSSSWYPSNHTKETVRDSRSDMNASTTRCFAERKNKQAQRRTESSRETHQDCMVQDSFVHYGSSVVHPLELRNDERPPSWSNFRCAPLLFFFGWWAVCVSVRSRTRGNDQNTKVGEEDHHQSRRWGRPSRFCTTMTSTRKMMI
jgi:hypothetical protein